MIIPSHTILRVTVLLAGVVIVGDAAAHGSLHERIALVSRRIATSPEDGELVLERARLRLRHGEVDAALADAWHALELDSGLVEARLVVARAELARGNAARARHALAPTFALGSPPPAARLLLARALVRLGDPLGAAAEYRHVVHDAPVVRPSVHLERFRALLRAGPEHFPAALAAIDEGIARLGPVVSLEFPAIDVELALGRVDAALVRLETLMTQAVRTDALLVRRAEILHAAGRGEEARTTARTALEQLESAPAIRRRTANRRALEARARRLLAGGEKTNPFDDDEDPKR